MKQASYFKNKSNLLRYELFKKMSEMQQDIQEVFFLF